jgi:hypothetical protein
MGPPVEKEFLASGFEWLVFQFRLGEELLICCFLGAEWSKLDHPELETPNSKPAWYWPVRKNLLEIIEASAKINVRRGDCQEL